MLVSYQLIPALQSSALEGIDIVLPSTELHSCASLQDSYMVRQVNGVVSTVDFSFLCAMTEHVPFHLGYTVT